MKKIILLIMIFVLPQFAAGVGISLKPMPDPMSKRRLKIQRPDGEKLLMAVSTKLKLSSKQQERVLKAMKKETKKFDKMLNEYKAAAEKEKKWRFKMNDIRHKMLKLNMRIPDLLRTFLDQDQQEMFDTLIENSMAPRKKRRKIKAKKYQKREMGKILKKKAPKKRKAPKKKLLEMPAVDEGEDAGYYP